MVQYTRHWCTAVRLAQNEPQQEARNEGAKDGDNIVAGFTGHPYIRNLARNPLMLSAICLVRYFERGELPEDRAVLYKLCVEGLLHHWDQRRGIHSEFSMEEKVRVCREVALAMQLDDRAEYEAEKIRETFIIVLGSEGRGRALFDHIRQRAGLLLEHRAGVFAFAHLTFQEYLAARAVHEGNRYGIDPENLARSHHDGRWKEVIALYCGLATAPATRAMLDRLMDQDDSRELAAVLTEAYFTSGPEIRDDCELRRRIIERVARAPMERGALNRFPVEEVAPTANSDVGTIRGSLCVSEAHFWLRARPQFLDRSRLRGRVLHRTTEDPVQFSELIFLAFMTLEIEDLISIADDVALISSRGPRFVTGEEYSSQAGVAILGLFGQVGAGRAETITRVLPRLLDRFLSNHPMVGEIFPITRYVMDWFVETGVPADGSVRRGWAAILGRLLDKAEEHLESDPHGGGLVNHERLKQMRELVTRLDASHDTPPAGC